MATFFYRHLPHFHLPHATYFVTFRLAGSLPVEVVQRLQEEHEAELRRLEQNLTGAALHQARYEEQKRHFARLDKLLDRALHGPRWLTQPECARIVIDCIHELHPAHYHLHAFCLMSNRVHLLLDQQGIEDPAPRWETLHRPQPCHASAQRQKRRLVQPSPGPVGPSFLAA